MQKIFLYLWKCYKIYGSIKLSISADIEQIVRGINMKKLISLALVLVIVLTLVPAQALAQGNTEKLKGNSVIDVSNTALIDEPSQISSKQIKNVGLSLSEDHSVDYDLTGVSKEELMASKEKYLPREEMNALEKHSEIDYRLTDKPLTGKAAEIVERKEARAAEIQSKIERAQAATKATVADGVVLITNENELKAIADQSGYYRLTCDIVLTEPWYPVSFYGVLEGGGYSIINADMTMYYEYDFVGFFDYLGPDAIVMNLNLVSPAVYANSIAGAFCGHNQGIISNCHVVDGFVITFLWADYEYMFWEISGSYVGGLVGINEGMIFDSTAHADVDGWTNVGGLVGENWGIVFACSAGGSVAYETNVYDIDWYGAEYYAYYGEEYYPTFTTYVRFMWAAFMIGEYDYIAYGLNGGFVGTNYEYVLDCYVQGKGSGTNYTLGPVAGLYGVGGFAGGEVGLIMHCYAIDRAFPLLPDGEVLWYPWEYADYGYGIYFDWDILLIHMGIGLNVSEYSDASCELFYFMASQGPACNDGAYHGTQLTAEQFGNPKTFKNWNHGDWNDYDIWIIEEGYLPILEPCPVLPTEWVITYTVGNGGGTLDNAYVVYRCVPTDENFKAKEPAPPQATNTAPGIGIAEWRPTTPYEGKEIGSDVMYTAYFGPVSTNPTGDLNGNGKLDTGDATVVLQYISGSRTLTAEQLKNADINKDGRVNTGDAVSILLKIVGK
jgi:hypothetical protein